MMGIIDNYKGMVKNSVQVYTSGTDKYGWLESVMSFLQYGLLLAVCFRFQWYIPAVLLVAGLIGMVFIVVKK